MHNKRLGRDEILKIEVRMLCSIPMGKSLMPHSGLALLLLPLGASTRVVTVTATLAVLPDRLVVAVLLLPDAVLETTRLGRTSVATVIVTMIETRVATPETVLEAPILGTSPSQSAPRMSSRKTPMRIPTKKSSRKKSNQTATAKTTSSTVIETETARTSAMTAIGVKTVPMAMTGSVSQNLLSLYIAVTF